VSHRGKKHHQQRLFRGRVHLGNLAIRGRGDLPRNGISYRGKGGKNCKGNRVLKHSGKQFFGVDGILDGRMYWGQKKEGLGRKDLPRAGAVIVEDLLGIRSNYWK